MKLTGLSKARLAESDGVAALKPGLDVRTFSPEVAANGTFTSKRSVYDRVFRVEPSVLVRHFCVPIRHFALQLASTLH